MTNRLIKFYNEKIKIPVTKKRLDKTNPEIEKCNKNWRKLQNIVANYPQGHAYLWGIADVDFDRIRKKLLKLETKRKLLLNYLGSYGQNSRRRRIYDN